MLKITFPIFLFIGLLSFTAIGQTKNTVYERYVDFNLARFENHADALQVGEKLLDSVAFLAPKVQISFYNGLAKLYEDSGKPDQAIIYFQKVALALPDYYVAQRALGYLYYKRVNDIGARLNASKGDKALNSQLTEAYKAAAKKALPYLEKAQACDPSDETLAIIKLLYKNVNDQAGLASLNQRLVLLSKNCVDLLSEQ